MSMEHWWNDCGGEILRYLGGGGVGGRACPIFILSNIIPKWPGLGLNLDACFERTATTTRAVAQPVIYFYIA